ncbi:RNA 2',3'-cyclic phosphodiesterase [Paenibacillus puerhi]|uniref:RNA 2',3'-cyclic phosphodiesterase n=1 Tax=Paenibacillus puerhi TaxID=2692622 RepID=UPI0013596CC6|nr:RNA 2',3'-cyclic phosphodiesterase [Paenibacillus puerhi]
MRVFTAVPLPEPIAKELESWVEAHRERLPFRKWTHPHDYHITLQFLGEASMSKVEALQADLKRIRQEPIALSLSRIGTFGPPKAPRILWSSVTGELTGLQALHAAVAQATQGHGFELEERAYAPHITLARNFVGASPLRLDSLEQIPAVAWKADSFVLMQTHMGASPMYERIGEYPLIGI